MVRRLAASLGAFAVLSVGLFISGSVAGPAVGVAAPQMAHACAWQLIRQINGSHQVYSSYYHETTYVDFSVYIYFDCNVTYLGYSYVRIRDGTPIDVSKGARIRIGVTNGGVYDSGLVCNASNFSAGCESYVYAYGQLSWYDNWQTYADSGWYCCPNNVGYYLSGS